MHEQTSLLTAIIMSLSLVGGVSAFAMLLALYCLLTQG